MPPLCVGLPVLGGMRGVSRNVALMEQLQILWHCPKSGGPGRGLTHQGCKWRQRLWAEALVDGHGAMGTRVKGFISPEMA